MPVHVQVEDKWVKKKKNLIILVKANLLQPITKMLGRQHLAEQKLTAGDSNPKEGISLNCSHLICL